MSRFKTALGLAVTSPRQLARAVRFRNGPPRLANLQRLIKASKPVTIVEIGVWRGETARLMIKAAARYNHDIHYWGFDLFSDGMSAEILKREVSLTPMTMSEVERQLEGLGAKITLVPGDSTETLPATRLPPIDFAFVDGGHSYETVSADWRNLRPKLSPGALVVFDDYTNEAAVEHEGYGVRALVDQLKREYRVDLLRPIDDFPRSYGPLKTRLAVLRFR
jgi:predicted O-methyltransferase YrrM